MKTKSLFLQMISVKFSSKRKKDFTDNIFPSNEANVQPQHWWDIFPSFFSYYFSRISVLFYLIIFIVQIFIETSLDYRVTLIPILLSLSSAISLDVVRAFRRHKLISKIDKNIVEVLRENEWIEIPMKNVCVGDILRLHNCDIAPADIILLSTSGNSPIAIDKHIIDGSSQLRKLYPRRELYADLKPEKILPTDSEKKTKFRLEYSRTFEKDEHLMKHPLTAKVIFNGYFTEINGKKYEIPSENDGNQNHPQNQVPHSNSTLHTNVTDPMNTSEPAPRITSEQFIERYSSIYHLGDVIAGVVYTGTDCRTVQNNHENRTKFTRLENKLNIQNSLQVCSILVISILLSGLSFVFYNINSSWPFELTFSVGEYFSKTLLQYLVILLPLSPLELYPMIDLVLFVHSMFMQAGNNKTVIPQISVIDEMTQIDTVITSKPMLIDKMPSISRLYLDGTMYGNCITPRQRAQSFSGFSDIQGQGNSSEFISSSFEELNSRNKRDLLLHFSICHSATVVKNDQFMGYISQYTDDEPLLRLAAQNGYEYYDRVLTVAPRNSRPQQRPPTGPNFQTAQVKIGNQIIDIPALAPFPPSPKHPRVSIIIEDNGVYKMYTRGTVESMQGIKDIPYDAVNKLQDQGLQVICCSVFEFANLNQLMDFIRSITSRRADRVNDPDRPFKNIDALEMSGRFLALVGFEEQARDGALMFISRAKAAGMQLVLSSHARVQPLVITCLSLGILDTKEKAGIIPPTSRDEDFEKAIDTIINEKSGIDVLIIPGPCIDKLFAIAKDKKLGEIVNVIAQAKTIIIGSADPAQTALFVDFLRKNCNKTAMGIGHSVSDSVFLQRTNISVSIGVDPVSPCDITSDFIVDKLDHLINIVFIQGGWLRDRMFSLMNYIFPRNTIFAFLQVVYGFYAAFSGTPLFDESQVLSILLVFTTFQPLSRAIFNQKVQETLLRTSPAFYNKSRVDRLSFKRFGITMGLSFIAALFIVAFSALVDKNIRQPFSDTISLYQFSYSVSGAFVLGCIGFLTPQCDSWHPINHLIIWGTTAMFFIIYSIETEDSEAGPTKGVASTMSSSLISTLLVFLVMIISIFIQFTYSLFKRLIENIKRPQNQRSSVDISEELIDHEEENLSIDGQPPINYQYIKEVSYIYHHNQPTENS